MIDFTKIQDSIPYILQGIPVLFQVVIVAAIAGMLIGIVVAALKITKNGFVRFIGHAYTAVFRGTPLILQLAIIHFGLPQLTGYVTTGYQSAVIAFSLNSGAYISEIIRAGIQAVDRGQWEAADALGIPYMKQLRSIILPQAFKNILPALMNELITLTKESALVSTVSVLDVMRRAQVVGGEKALYFEPLLFAGFIYFVLVMGLSLIGQQVEKAMRKSG
ncbi:MULTISPECIES: amino acid ABC transporter permease [Exiguobacterium]|uniref:amino acid ABC transporter permease n=1 Tax=Exiguobacterium TaxID=33986 RepID=UPI000DF785F9|nr:MULTISPECIES: amino acid ABC transporter permease [Exiguobacterium]MDW2885511.1 amino acid ABC transporter permease [Exiguobacterium sibiricum]RDB34679.1 amino acid ABC transporter permease [Exiguobacterium sp. RIT594]